MARIFFLFLVMIVLSCNGDDETLPLYSHYSWRISEPLYFGSAVFEYGQNHLTEFDEDSIPSCGFYYFFTEMKGDTLCWEEGFLKAPDADDTRNKIKKRRN